MTAARDLSRMAQPWRRRLAASAVALCVAAFVLDLVLGAASWVPLLYVMPIAVVAILFGVPAGLAAGTISLGLVALANELTGGARSVALYTVLAVIFALVGTLAYYRETPDDELGPALKPLKKVCTLLLMVLISIVPAVAPAASTPPVVNTYQVQAEYQVARVEDVNPAHAWSTAVDLLLDELDDDQLSRYRDAFESLRSYLGTADAGSPAATSVVDLADALSSGELERGTVLGALHRAGVLEDPERALRTASSELLLEETNEAATRLALVGGDPVAEADVAEVLVFVESELPQSEPAARLRQHPLQLVVEIERGAEGDPDLVMLIAQGAAGIAGERAFDALVGFVTRRRRDRREAVDALGAVREHVLEVFRSSRADVVAEERLEGGATRWELVLDDGRRVEARATADGAVLDACVRGERTAEENRERFDREARTPDNWVWLDARGGLRDRLENGERLLGLCGCGRRRSLVPQLVLFTSKRLLWSRRKLFSTTTGELRWRDARSIDEPRHDRLVLHAEDGRELTLSGLNGVGVRLEDERFPFDASALRRRILDLIERNR